MFQTRGGYMWLQETLHPILTGRRAQTRLAVQRQQLSTRHHYPSQRLQHNIVALVYACVGGSVGVCVCVLSISVSISTDA